jgi:Xaa-Pro aminopeptidase
MRTLHINPQFFKTRRNNLAALMKGSAIILPAWPEYIRNYDTQFLYRQESNLLYMTGFDEPGSCLIFRPGQTPETVMFVRAKNVERETWDGFRYGQEGAKERFGFDEVYLIDDIETKAPQLLKDCEKVYYSLFRNTEFDPIFGRILSNTKALRPRAGMGFQTVEDAYGLLGELRMRKTEEEIDMLRRAGSVSAKAHLEVMKATRPSMSERALQGLFIKSIMEQGSFGEAYPGIFATGSNAVTLHYRWNESTLKDGQMLLVDAGAEYMYYSGDITRTYPVNGRFNPAQKQIYSSLLELQEKTIAAVRPGVPHGQLQEMTIQGIAKILIEEKLVKGSIEDVIRTKAYSKYYMHGVSHLLGLDTHDAGSLLVGGRSRQMEAGWCFTVEPGIYIPANDMEAPAELRGLGMRIEDDLIVTESGAEVITNEAPKSVADLEAVIGQG